MKKRTEKTRTNDVGLTRLYQAWAFLPWFDDSFGEWYHARSGPIGNPRTSAKACQKDIEAWLTNNKSMVDKLNKEVAESGRFGNDIRVVIRVYQIWPMTDNSPWSTGMFNWVEDLS